MTTISVQIDGDEPVLLIDGARVAPESLVTLPAEAIAKLAHANREYGRSEATDPRPRTAWVSGRRRTAYNAPLGLDLG